MQLKEEIIQKAGELGIDLIGFSAAIPLADVQGYLQKRLDEGRQTTLECQNIAQRVDPDRILPGARTIITAGLAYYQAPPQTGGLRGAISRSAWGVDYHRVLGGQLIELADFITGKAACEVRTFVDTGPPVDRALAIKAGLGWGGKNCALINEKYGSWVFLGQLYTTLELLPDEPVAAGCGECTICLNACPTGALQQGYNIDPFRCISYLTQMKGFIPRQYRRLMGDRLYGCDTCQLVCPANRQVKETTVPEFRADPEIARPELLSLLKLTNREFKEKFGISAAGWRGRTVLQRNAIIALGNLKSPETVPALIECLEDPRAVIRGHAAWALAAIGDNSALPKLRLALEQERDEQAADEMQEAIFLVGQNVLNRLNLNKRGFA